MEERTTSSNVPPASRRLFAVNDDASASHAGEQEPTGMQSCDDHSQHRVGSNTFSTTACDSTTTTTTTAAAAFRLPFSSPQQPSLLSHPQTPRLIAVQERTRQAVRVFASGRGGDTADEEALRRSPPLLYFFGPTENIRDGELNSRASLLSSSRTTLCSATGGASIYSNDGGAEDGEASRVAHAACEGTFDSPQRYHAQRACSSARSSIAAAAAAAQGPSSSSPPSRRSAREGEGASTPPAAMRGGKSGVSDAVPAQVVPLGAREWTSGRAASSSSLLPYSTLSSARRYGHYSYGWYRGRGPLLDGGGRSNYHTPPRRDGETYRVSGEYDSGGENNDFGESGWEAGEAQNGLCCCYAHRCRCLPAACSRFLYRATSCFRVGPEEGEGEEDPLGRARLLSHDGDDRHSGNTYTSRFTPPPTGKSDGNPLRSPRGTDSCLLETRSTAVSSRTEGRQGCSHAGCCRCIAIRLGLLSDYPPVGATHERRLPCVSRVYCLLHYLATALMALAVCIVIASILFAPRTISAIRDGTVCTDYTFHDRLKPDLTFSLLCFVINSGFALWCAIRAVRLEQPGLLLGQVVVVVLQVCRVVYFCFSVASRYLQGDVALVIRVMLLSSAAMWCTASLLSFTVQRTFGWRSFSQGITHRSNLQLHRRQMFQQTCVQIDVAVTLNAALAILFLLDIWVDEVANLIMAAISMAAVIALSPLMRYTRRFWPILLAAMTLIASFFFFTAVMGRSLAAHHLNAHGDKNPRELPCYTGALHYCLDSAAVDVANVTSYLCKRYDFTGKVVSHVVSVSSPFYSPSESITALHRPIPSLLAGDAGASSPYVATLENALPSLAVFSLWPWGQSERRRSRRGWKHRSSTHDTGGASVSEITNSTNTYLPTYSDLGECFELIDCDATCFAEHAGDYARRMDRCCASYGTCLRKDAFRFYGVVLLASLVVIAFVERITLLVVAWGRYTGDDEEALRQFRALRARGIGGGGTGGGDVGGPPFPASPTYMSRLPPLPSSSVVVTISSETGGAAPAATTTRTTTTTTMSEVWGSSDAHTAVPSSSGAVQYAAISSGGGARGWMTPPPSHSERVSSSGSLLNTLRVLEAQQYLQQQQQYRIGSRFNVPHVVWNADQYDAARRQAQQQRPYSSLFQTPEPAGSRASTEASTKSSVRGDRE